jgi:hypothetical protein
MPNIQEAQFKRPFKGNGSQRGVAHRKVKINGKLTQNFMDGCLKNPGGS